MKTFQDTLNLLRHRQQLLAIMIFTFAAALVWIATSLVTSQRKESISPELKKMAEPLNPTVNRDVLRNLGEEIYYAEESLYDFPMYRFVDEGSSQLGLVIGGEEAGEEETESSSELTEEEVEAFKQELLELDEQAVATESAEATESAQPTESVPPGDLSTGDGGL